VPPPAQTLGGWKLADDDQPAALARPAA